MSRTALITGITGQDGSYLAELLLEKDYRVFGLVRSSDPEPPNIRHLLDRLVLIPGDLTDGAMLDIALRISNPDEVYNLAARTFVPAAWDDPERTLSSNGLGALRMLEAMRGRAPHTRFFQASTSEMFGDVRESPQNEQTPFFPRTLYGVAKATAHWTTVNYRRKHGLFAVSGILFNHESPRRGLEFVTRKITHTVARISLGLTDQLVLGDLDARRDWGFAGDYVKAMWLMLQQAAPNDFVIGTGVAHTVREFVELAFATVGLDWTRYVRQDPALLRPPEPHILVADPSAARDRLGWSAQVDLQELVKMMVDHDVHTLQNTA